MVMTKKKLNRKFWKTICYTDEKRSELKKIFADNPNVQICSLGDLYEN